MNDAPEQLKLGMLFPPQSNILEVEIKTAARVARVVFESNLARVARPEDYEAFIRGHVYNPQYRSLRLACLNYPHALSHQRQSVLGAMIPGLRITRPHRDQERIGNAPFLVVLQNDGRRFGIETDDGAVPVLILFVPEGHGFVFTVTLSYEMSAQRGLG